MTYQIKLTLEFRLLLRKSMDAMENDSKRVAKLLNCLNTFWRHHTGITMALAYN